MKWWDRLRGKQEFTPEQLSRGFPPITRPLPPPPEPAPEPPPPETEKEKAARLKHEEESRMARERRERRDALRERFARLLQKVDFDTNDEPYGQLSYGDAVTQARGIIEALNHIIDVGNELDAWDTTVTAGLYGDEAAKNVAALLYVGLRQRVTLFLCELLEKSGVAEAFADTAFEEYVADDEINTDFDEYQSEDDE